MKVLFENVKKIELKGNRTASWKPPQCGFKSRYVNFFKRFLNNIFCFYMWNNTLKMLKTLINVTLYQSILTPSLSLSLLQLLASGKL